MSHELRTPLNGILGYAQILKRDATLTAKQEEGLRTIEKCGSHLLTLINDILDLTKVEVGKLVLMPEDFYLGKFLDHLVELCRLRAQEKGLTFTYHASPSLPIAIHADKKRLRQVLLNLLSNANSFTHVGTVMFTVNVVTADGHPPATLNMGPANHRQGPWLVSLTPPAASDPQPAVPPPHRSHCRLRFQVSDTGIGIPPDCMERIFLPFEQITNRQRSAEGTGLGLAITQQVLQLMGSSLQVDSVVDQGSTFWFELVIPIAQEWPTDTPPPPAHDNVSIPGELWMPPPPEIIQRLHDLIRKGNFKGVLHQIDQLEQLHPAYIPLVRRCRQLAQDFEEQALLQLISYYQGSEPSPPRRHLDLTAMPSEWLTQLYQAARQLDAQQVSHLIAEIPAEKAALAQDLTQKVNNFDFEQIMNLAQAAEDEGNP